MSQPVVSNIVAVRPGPSSRDSLRALLSEGYELFDSVGWVLFCPPTAVLQNNRPQPEGNKIPADAVVTPMPQEVIDRLRMVQSKE